MKRLLFVVAIVVSHLAVTQTLAETNTSLEQMPLPMDMQKEKLLQSLQEVSKDIENLGPDSYTNVSTLVLFEDRWTDEQILKNLSSHNYALVQSSLSILAERGNTNGVPTARILLNTRFGWLTGATYLGKIGEKSAIPYLIKGLRKKHATGLYLRIGEHLTKLTGQYFGTDFSRWHAWWLENHPDSVFDFDSDLGGFAPDTWDPSSGSTLEPGDESPTTGSSVP